MVDPNSTSRLACGRFIRSIRKASTDMSSQLFASTTIGVLPYALQILWTVASVQAQVNSNPNPDASIESYQRIFVNQSELKEGDLPGYVQVELRELQDLLDNAHDYGVIGKDTNAVDGAQVIASHYVARLIGADLVSDRSRIALSHPARSGDRVTLSPWTLALSNKILTQASSGVPTNGQTNRLSFTDAWSFNAQGQPRVPAYRSAASSDGSYDPALKQTVHWFGWSSKAIAESLPNRLRYSFEVPQCVDSCLVLTLPPRAIVIDSSTVARKLDKWSDTSTRIGSTSNFETDPMTASTSIRSTDTIWLIELSGQSSCSFTIALGASDKEKPWVQDQAFENSQLVSAQTIRHSLEGENIRTTLDASLKCDPKHPVPLRLSLPAGSSVRKLTVNQREIEFQLIDGSLQWDLPSMVSPSEVAVSALFLTNVQPEDREIDLPRFVFDHSYVIAGRVSINAQSPWRLGACDASTGRLVDDRSPNRINDPGLVEYSWYGVPPAMRIQLQQESAKRQLSTLTRIEHEGPKIIAKVHAMLSFLPQDSGRASVFCAPGWTIRSVTQFDDPSNNASQSGNVVDLEWIRMQPSRTAEVDLVLESTPRIEKEQTKNNASTQLRKTLLEGPIITIPGWNVSGFLSVENSIAFPLHMSTQLLTGLVLEESLSDDERTLIAKQEGLLKKEGFSLFKRALNDSISTLTLVWTETSNTHLMDIDSSVSMASNEQAVIEHEIAIRFASQGARELLFELPLDANVQSDDSLPLEWAIKETDHWIVLVPTALGSTDDGVRWLLALPAEQETATLRMIDRPDFDVDSRLVVTLPKFLNATRRSQQIKSYDQQIRLRSITSKFKMRLGKDGQPSLELDSESKFDPIAGEILVQKAPTDTNLDIQSMNCEMHLAVDAFGAQRALITIVSRSSILNQAAEFEFDQGWEVVATNSINLDNHSTWKLEFELVGPRLTGADKTFQSHAFSLSWPTVRFREQTLATHRGLWLPNELVCWNKTEDDGLGSGWLLWMESQHVWRQISSDATQRTSNTLPSLVSNPSKILPETARNHWYLARKETEVNSLFARQNAEPLQLKIRRQDASNANTMPLFCMVLFSLVTPWWLAKHPRGLVCVALTGLVVMGFASDAWAAVAQGACLGMLIGFVVAVLVRCMNPRNSETGSQLASNSRSWIPWDHRDESDRGSQRRSARVGLGSGVNGTGTIIPKILFLGVLLGQWMFYQSVGLAQSNAAAQTTVLTQSEFNGRDFKVVVPITDTGELADSKVYVPESVRNELMERVQQSQIGELETKPISAKHLLRIGFRGRSDQLTMTYEFMVGPKLTPIRFPINNDQLQSARFSLDNMDINPSSRLRRAGNDWEWTPDRPGKRSLQIVAMPVLKSLGSAQKLNVSLLPVGNATLEIDIEPQLSIEVGSLGQVNNPASGRYVAQLGSIDQLQCAIFPSSPTGALGDANELPVMNTELLIQDDVLQARTTVDYPKNVQASREIEIEADSQWLPVGTQWGDARWIDIRPGSTLARRRYLLEWNQDPPSSDKVSEVARDKQISVLWVPQTKTQNLNILFAECRDRRTRRGTLRYAIGTGANWTLDGISTWIPAISPKERLDWPELKSNPPRATTLRIPLGGGFGLLKPKLNLDRQQARVSVKWNVERNQESISYRIELLGSNSTSKTLKVDLPSAFTVTEIYNKNGPIRFLQHAVGDRQQLQLLVDRRSLELNDTWIKAVRTTTGLGEPNKSPESNGPTILEESNVVPWINFPSNISLDQMLELTASENMAIQFNESKEPVIGKGIAQSIVSMSRNAFNDRITGSLTTTYQRVVRSAPLQGKMLLHQTKSAESLNTDLLLLGKLTQSVQSYPWLVTELPAEWKDRVQSEFRTSLLPCPRSDRVWLRIQIPVNARNDSGTIALGRIEVRPDEIAKDSKLFSKVRALDASNLETYFTNGSLARDEPQIRSADPSRDGWQTVESSLASQIAVEFGFDQETRLFKSVDTNTASIDRAPSTSVDNAPMELRFVAHRLLNVPNHRNDHTTDSKSNDETVLLVSNYGFKPIDDSLASHTLTWSLANQTNVTDASIRINGAPTKCALSGNQIQCDFPPTALPISVELTTTHRMVSIANRIKTIHLPLFSQPSTIPSVILNSEKNIEYMLDGQKQFAIDARDFADTIAKQSVQLLDETVVAYAPRLSFCAAGSEWETWLSYWSLSSYDNLQQCITRHSSDWTKDTEPHEQLANAIRAWHRIKPLSQSTLDENARRAFNGRIQFAMNSINRNLDRSLDVSNASATKTPVKFDVQTQKTASLLMGLSLVIGTCVVVSNFSKPLLRRPWYALSLLGVLVWIATGSIAFAFSLGLVGLILALDSYWVTSVRPRRSGTRGLR
jgi:hypothetical protein